MASHEALRWRLGSCDHHPCQGDRLTQLTATSYVIPWLQEPGGIFSLAACGGNLILDEAVNKGSDRKFCTPEGRVRGEGQAKSLHQPLEASLALGFCCDYFQTLRGKFKGPGPTSDGAPSGGVVLKYKPFGSRAFCLILNLGSTR